MIEKQLSVFIENKQGRLGEVLQVLKDNEVNIQSLSLADTTEYGLLRLIVDKPEVGKDKLFEAGFSSMLTSVLIVDVPHSPGSLQTVLKTILLINEASFLWQEAELITAQVHSFSLCTRMHLIWTDSTQLLAGLRPEWKLWMQFAKIHL